MNFFLSLPPPPESWWNGSEDWLSLPRELWQLHPSLPRSVRGAQRQAEPSRILRPNFVHRGKLRQWSSEVCSPGAQCARTEARTGRQRPCRPTLQKVGADAGRVHVQQGYPAQSGQKPEGSRPRANLLTTYVNSGVHRGTSPLGTG